MGPENKNETWPKCFWSCDLFTISKVPQNGNDYIVTIHASWRHIMFLLCLCWTDQSQLKQSDQSSEVVDPQQKPRGRGAVSDLALESGGKVVKWGVRPKKPHETGKVQWVRERKEDGLSYWHVSREVFAWTYGSPIFFWTSVDLPSKQLAPVRASQLRTSIRRPSAKCLQSRKTWRLCCSLESDVVIFADFGHENWVRHACHHKRIKQFLGMAQAESVLLLKS